MVLFLTMFAWAFADLQHELFHSVQQGRSLDSRGSYLQLMLEQQGFVSSDSVELQVKLAEGLPDGTLDPELVSLALENILRNAYEAMPAGGTLGVETQPAQDADAVLVSVDQLVARALHEQSARRAEAVLQALSRAGNKRTVAARLLGVSRRTLYDELEELGIE